MDLDVVNIIAADAATDTMISFGSFFCYAAVADAATTAMHSAETAVCC